MARTQPVVGLVALACAPTAEAVACSKVEQHMTTAERKEKWCSLDE